MRLRLSFCAAVFLTGCGIFGTASDDTPPSEPPPAPPADDAGSSGTVTGTGADATLTVDAIGKTFVTQGTSAKLTVKIHRGAAVLEDVVLSATGLRDGITATGTIPAGSSEGQLTIDVPAAAAQGDLALTIEATAPSSDVRPVPKGTAPAALFVRGTPGALDTTFGKDGVQQIVFGNQGFGLDVFVGADGASTLLGTCSGSSECLARLGANGFLDKTFGGDGTGFHGYGGIGRVLAHTTDGKFLVAGGGPAQPVGVARVAANGGLDTTFGAAGVREFTPFTGTASNAYALGQGPTGDFVLAFDWTVGGLPTVGTAKLTSAGAFVAGYGQQNVSSAGLGDAAGALVTGIALRPDGRVVGAAASYGGKSFYAFQIKTDGAYDPTYGTNGITKVAAPNGAHRYEPESATSLVLLPDGSIVTAIKADAGVFLAKFTAAGVLDPTFGTGGIGPASDVGDNGDPCGLLQDAAGNFLVPVIRPATSMRIARFKPDGTLDTTFGRDGVARAQGGESRRAAIAPDGRIVLVGYTSLNHDAFVVRFWN